MKNLFSASAVFDVREYPGCSIVDTFPYPYTFLLSQGEYICSVLALPKQLVPPDVVMHGVGFATRTEAEVVRKKIIENLSENDLLAIIYRNTGVPRGECIVACVCPSDAVAHIRRLEKDIPTPENFSPMPKFTATTHPWYSRHALHFEFHPSKRYYHGIQLVQRVPASSAVPPLLNWDAIGIK